MKTSAARRLNDVFHKASKVHDDRKPGTFHAWIQVFGISDGSQLAETEDAVTSLLQDVRADITAFEAGLRGTEAESLASEIVSQARLFTSPAKFSTDWRAHKGNYLAPQTLKHGNGPHFTFRRKKTMSTARPLKSCASCSMNCTRRHRIQSCHPPCGSSFFAKLRPYVEQSLDTR